MASLHPRLLQVFKAIHGHPVGCNLLTSLRLLLPFSCSAVSAASIQCLQASGESMKSGLTEEVPTGAGQALCLGLKLEPALVTPHHLPDLKLQGLASLIVSELQSAVLLTLTCFRHLALWTTVK